MPDSDEPVWEHMHKKPTDKLSRSQSGGGRGARFVVFALKGDGLRGETKDSGVGDGDVVGVSTQVFNDVGRPFESFLEMGNPLLRIERGEKCFKLPGILEHDFRERKDQFPFLVQLFQPLEEFSPKKSGYGFDGKQETCLGRDELLVLAESSPQDDGVDVGMIGKVASPGMEDTDEPDLGPQMPFVLGKLLEGFRTALVEQMVEDSLIGKHEAVQLGRHRKDCMKIRRIHHIGFSCINPLFFGECLTAGTVPITTRVVMNLGGPAVLTDCLVSAHHGRLAPQDGCGDLVGVKGKGVRLLIIGVRVLEDFLNGVTHGFTAHRRD